MRFALAIFSLAISALAQSSKPNSFNIPDDGTQVFNAGQSSTLTWSNPTGSTVTLLLRSGSNGDLQTVSTIVESAPNTGSYTWTPDANTPEGADYAIEIIDDQDNSVINYTPQFVIKSNVKAVATTSGATSLVTVTSGSASASASASGSMTSGASASASTTGSASASSGTSSATNSAAASSSGSASTSASASPSRASVATNAAARPAMQAGAGLLAVAVGFVVAL